MTATAFLAHADELDQAIREQDALIVKALFHKVHEKFVWRAMQCRNDLARAWGDAWRTRVVP